MPRCKISAVNADWVMISSGFGTDPTFQIVADRDRDPDPTPTLGQEKNANGERLQRMATDECIVIE
jgi:hypothetical protein